MEGFLLCSQGLRWVPRALLWLGFQHVLVFLLLMFLVFQPISLAPAFLRVLWAFLGVLALRCVTQVAWSLGALLAPQYGALFEVVC